MKDVKIIKISEVEINKAFLLWNSDETMTDIEVNALSKEELAKMQTEDFLKYLSKVK